MTTISGSRILITGAASGFGKLMALQMAQKGGQLILWDINKEGLDAVKKEINGQGNDVVTMICNLRNREEINQCASKVLDMGPIDILVNNAGIVSGKPFLELTPDQIESTFEINTLAHFWTTQSFLPAMIKQNKGHLVTIASSAGFAGTSKLVDYCSSKFAAVGFDEALRAELRGMKSKVRTSVICPYVANTGMFKGVKKRFFLLPVLKPEKVVSKTIKVIEKNRRRLLIPRFVYTALICKLLPVWLYDWIGDTLGVNNTMDGFVGRN
ncbi:MAG: short-chain dehydrogenase [Euryarchaeota archaeon]|nr:short-chain dehydrogenase [Euryarchaeota archaeon]|tara:strand:+ start:7465 stop:8268 length:804 start_codon:yes stop_codon:yes gene_type:complete